MSWGSCEWGAVEWGAESCVSESCDSRPRAVNVDPVVANFVLAIKHMTFIPEKTWTLVLPGARCQSHRRQTVSPLGGGVKQASDTFVSTTNPNPNPNPVG